MVPFAQVDVFSAAAYLGNPVAVVLDGSGVSEDGMQRFAAWTNLSETTFVVPPSSADADYGLRIFTPGGELPFAGHPTLGSAHAWLEAGGTPAAAGLVVQECPLGLVTLRRSGEGRLSFRAPELLRSGPLDEADVDRIAQALGVERDAIVAHQWVDNGPGWAAVQLASADAVLALEPDPARIGDLMVGVAGLYPPGSEHFVEVRVFAAGSGVVEDPVTGSFNAGLAQWLIGSGAAPRSYTAGQGARVGRRGVVEIDARDDGIWVGGACVTRIRGHVDL